MTDRELMQQALDALEGYARNCRCEGGGAPCDTAEALRARLANEFNPDWDAMAVMVEEQQRMAKRIEELEATLAQPEQEPVAWIKERELLYMQAVEAHGKTDWKTNLGLIPEEGDMPLYTAPPQREWQGLTDEEILEEYRQSYGDDGNLTDVYFAHAIEAKLKDKNA